MTLIIIIAMVALVLLWVMSVQRTLVSKEEFCKNSLSQIGVQQASRWDALKALAEMTKSYSDFEYKTITDVIAQRKAITGSSSVADANAQERLLGTAMNHINVVAEQYPQLKASDTYVKTMDSINTYENQVRMSRMVFNDTVTKYNKLIRQIPDSFVASLLGFQAREYLKEVASKADMPSMNI